MKNTDRMMSDTGQRSGLAQCFVNWGYARTHHESLLISCLSAHVLCVWQRFCWGEGRNRNMWFRTRSTDSRWMWAKGQFTAQTAKLQFYYKYKCTYKHFAHIIYLQLVSVGPWRCSVTGTPRASPCCSDEPPSSPASLHLLRRKEDRNRND